MHNPRKRLSARRLIGLAAVVTVTVTGLEAPAVAAPAEVAPAAVTDSVTWGECANISLRIRAAECGYLVVPLDHAQPTGETIELAISRIKAKVPAEQYQGIMLINPGGPGGSGLNLPVLGELLPGDASDAYDWIGFDPRGVGSSRPALSCQPDYFDGPRPEYVPSTLALEQAWLTRSAEYAAACGRNGGTLLEHMSTVDTVRDMDSIRVALGQEQLNFYGFSYGTYLGQVYSTLYPQRVRRMVLDSNVDPRNVWHQANLVQDVTFERNMKIWFGWLARHNNVYGLGRTARAVERIFYAEREKLRVEPAGGVVGPGEWTDIFLSAGYYQTVWLRLADAFAGWVHERDASTIVAEYHYAHPPGDDNAFAVYNAVQCTDSEWPVGWITWLRDNWRTYATAPFYTWGNAWFNAPCLFWPVQAEQPVVVDGSGVNGILLVGAELDAATPFEGSLEVRRRFPNARLIGQPGGTSHATTVSGNACLGERITAYLATGALPARADGDQADALCLPVAAPEPATPQPVTEQSRLLDSATAMIGP